MFETQNEMVLKLIRISYLGRKLKLANVVKSALQLTRDLIYCNFFACHITSQLLSQECYRHSNTRNISCSWQGSSNTILLDSKPLIMKVVRITSHENNFPQFHLCDKCHKIQTMNEICFFSRVELANQIYRLYHE